MQWQLLQSLTDGDNTREHTYSRNERKMEEKKKKKKKGILGHAGETVRASLFSLLHSFFCHEGEIGSERITISHRSRGFLLNLCREVQR